MPQPLILLQLKQSLRLNVDPRQKRFHAKLCIKVYGSTASYPFLDGQGALSDGSPG
jgi:hypothetical protein